MLKGGRELRRAESGSGDSVSGGLGLRIAASFAEANGGALELLDRPGGGTVARLDLPAVPEPEEVPA
jgi:signal transduction histidine kinase